jgi:hypothetical protein
MKLRSLSLIVLPVCLFSCAFGAGTGTTTATPPSPLQVGAEINRSYDSVDGTTQAEWYFSITYNGVPIGNEAAVSFNSTPVPATYGFTGWSYSLTDAGGASYVPGGDYTIAVTYGGTTYTETVQAPGAITVSPDHAQVTWLYGGDHSVISTNYTFGAGTYQMPGSLGPLTSTHVIPASAYPETGQSYDLNINIGTLKDGFGTLHGDGSYVWVFDYTRRRFTK